MSDRYFLDTNILVYCFDRTDARKRAAAEKLVKQALGDHRGIISSQVVQEFLNVATRKFSQPMNQAEARAYLDTVLTPLCEVFPSFSLYQQALGLQAETGYSFYDCLILGAALEGGCTRLCSEDFQPGHQVRGLTIVNPLAKGR